MTGRQAFSASRLKSDPAYADGFRDGLEAEHFAELRVRAESARVGLAFIKRRSIGWNGANGGFYFWFVGWDCLSLGAHVCLSAPNIEIHLPFGFIRLGWHTSRKARRQVVEDAKYMPEGVSHE